MAYYIGIDLGTTNSAIVTFDGEKTRVWKTKEQTDVTPSCIFIDKKGRQFVGNKAYKSQGREGNENRVAKQFKRFMGTSTKIEFADKVWTPEQCSAEVLKELFRCLPEDITQSKDRYTVITVPAAFDQMQNEATKKAAEMAGIGHVAVMQEPVAAIMSVMHNTEIRNGSFMIFDMGGGTLDVAIANCVNGKVDVIAHGGVAMCGGTDIDRKIVDNIIKPWLLDNDDYDIPDNFMEYEKYRKMMSRVRFWAEEAKIALSSDETAEIYGALGRDITDENDEEIELDIEIGRDDLNRLMNGILLEAIECARETVKKSGIPISDFEGVVFIGGPCNYKWLRDYVAREMGMKILGLDVINPMTAVAEGASIFAESIDWTSVEHERKASNQVMTAEALGLDFKYEARTTKEKARFMVKAKVDTTGYSFELRSADTGWSSGTLELKNGAMLTLPLAKKGANTFEIYIYDPSRRLVTLPERQIVITRTLSTIGAITASHTISVEVREGSLSNVASLDTLVHEGDKLPAKGTRRYKAIERIKAGDTNGALRLKLWEGNITSKVTDNKFIGMIKVEGTDLDYGAIRPGDDIEFNYTINEAGSLDVEVSIERLGIVKNEKNFYDSESAQKDMNSEDTVYELEDEGQSILQQADELEADVSDDRLDTIRELAEESQSLADDPVIDPERVKKNSDNLIKAKVLLNKIKEDNQENIREKALADIRAWYQSEVEPLCNDTERNDMQSMIDSLARLVRRKTTEFEELASSIRGKGYWEILFERSTSFVGGLFSYLRSRPYNFADREQYHQLVQEGESAIENDDFDRLKRVVATMIVSQKQNVDMSEMSAAANIMRS